MSYIYDGFPSEPDAMAFAQDVIAASNASAAVFLTQDEANEHDPFPYRLTPPIVHVSREDQLLSEEALAQLARDHGVRFAGT